MACLDAEPSPCIINPDMITRINQWTGTSVTELVGDTPLLELPNISAEVPGVRIFGKAEWYNPGGSVKDRPRCDEREHGDRVRLDRGRFRI
jgi:S-sulfo-L-cysteine synthase (O-acetyl-L-serine-dependent)